jgi:hypothetical protein
MELWQLYLLVQLPIIGGLLQVVGSVTSLLLTIVVVCLTVENEQELPIYKPATRALVIMLTLTLVGWFTPTTKGMYTLVGGYVVANTQGVADLPPNMVKAANKFLEQYTEK